MQKGIKRRIGILRGGMGEHYISSLKKGGSIISHIVENLHDKYKVFDIFVDKDYIWHLNGVPIKPADLIYKVDVVWNTAHPSFLNIIENLSIPHIGSSFFLGSSKELLKKYMKNIGVNMPRSIFLPKSAREVLEKFPAPWRVGHKLVRTFPELTELIENNKSILVEEFISGRVASVHSVRGFRGHLSAQAGDFYVFPPVNIFGVLSSEEKEKLKNLSKEIHGHLNGGHYLKLYFIVNKKGKIFLSDFESTPNLDPTSHFAQACESAGAKMHHVVEHILEQV